MSRPMPKVIEGEVEFNVAAANKPCKTWYKIIGDLSAGRPLVVIHGGPGLSHEYLLPLADLASSASIPVVFYDQIGNARSTHLPEKNGDKAFWTVDLFCDELDNLVRRLGIEHDFALCGHSWGGMLAADYATRQPNGLKRLILADAPASMYLLLEAAKLLRSELPQDLQDAITKYKGNSAKQCAKDGPSEQRDGDDAKDYEQAAQKYTTFYTCRMDPLPEEFIESFRWMGRDYTVTGTMWGPIKFIVNGTLRTWSVVDRIHKIQAPTLLINGRYDEAQDICLRPFFHDLPKVKWVQFAESSHLPHWEERERFIEVVGDFLTA